MCKNQVINIIMRKFDYAFFPWWVTVHATTNWMWFHFYIWQLVALNLHLPAAPMQHAAIFQMDPEEFLRDERLVSVRRTCTLLVENGRINDENQTGRKNPNSKRWTIKTWKTKRLVEPCFVQRTVTYRHFAVRSGRDGEHCLQK